MQLFTGNIAKAISIRQVGRDLNISYPLVHRAITPLIRIKQYLKLSENKLVQLNYQEHHDVLAYVEYLRRNELLKKRHVKPIKDFLKEVLEKFDQEYFIIILFGSAVESPKPGDYDILFIFENNNAANERKEPLTLLLQTTAISSTYRQLEQRVSLRWLQKEIKRMCLMNYSINILSSMELKVFTDY